MSKLRVGSVFAGVGGLCGGFQDEGFEIAWQVEIDDAARGVLDHLYPGVPKYRDIRDVGAKCLAPVDVLVGGFPCTDLSVAGAREGINAKRSGLFFEMMRVADELSVPWVVWENVVGLLSSFSPCEDPPGDLPEGADWEVEESSDFETVLRAFAARGYRGAWRVLDCQHFGPPQRRERVFGVFTRLPAGAERAAEVLALAASVCGDPPKGRKAKADVAAPLTGGTPGSGPGCGEDAAAGHLVVIGQGFADSGVPASLLSRNQRGDLDTETFVIQCHGSNVGPMGTLRAGNGNHTGGVPILIQDVRNIDKAQNGAGFKAGVAYTLQANNHQGVIYPADGVAGTQVSTDGGGSGEPLSRVVCVTGEVTHTLTHEGHDASEDGTGRGTPIVASPYPLYYSHDYNQDRVYGINGLSPALCSEQSGGSRNFLVPHTMPQFVVRRLTPLECERLMGWRDGTTAVKMKKGKPVLQKDAPRYKQVGNGVVHPVARYIARRLKRVMESPELFEDPSR